MDSDLRHAETRLLAKLKPDPATACWEFQGKGRISGYGAFGFKAGGRWRCGLAHRAAAKIWLGLDLDAPRSLQVLHACDNKLCCNPAHLSIGTLQENMDDMVAKGRQATGSRNGMAIITPEAADAIRAARPATLSTERGRLVAELSAALKVARCTVYRVWSRGLGSHATAVQRAIWEARPEGSRWAEAALVRELAARYGVHVVTIQRIWKGDTHGDARA